MLKKILYKIQPFLKETYLKILYSTTPNLIGDRDVEWAFVAGHVGSGPGRALDFGCGPASYLGLIAAEAGYDAIAFDLEPVRWFYQHPRLQYLKGDILVHKFEPRSFDLIINCSSIEHVGLAKRYGVEKTKTDGDLEAMAIMKDILSTKGRMILTIPAGKDTEFLPLHRVYGAQRLPQLLNGFTVEHKEYWGKDENNKWVLVSEEIALNKTPTRDLHCLGCFVLEPK